MTKDDRWKFNKAFSAQTGVHGYTVVSIDPQQHMKWLNDYKQTDIIPRITSIMEKKGYRNFDKDLIISYKAMYNPFRFKWSVI